MTQQAAVVRVLGDRPFFSVHGSASLPDQMKKAVSSSSSPSLGSPSSSSSSFEPLATRPPRKRAPDVQLPPSRKRRGAQGNPLCVSDDSDRETPTPSQRRCARERPHGPAPVLTPVPAEVLERVCRLTAAASQRAIQKLCGDSSTRTSCAFESQDVSLLCPVSLVLIRTPVRGKYCCHLGCFDLLTFFQGLLGGEVRGSGKCPLCPIQLRLPTLILDELFVEMLGTAPSGTTHAQVFPDGTWRHRPVKLLAVESVVVD